MAGRRQHYVPRFLLRGFLDKSFGDAEQTWLHRSKQKPKAVGIRDVGVAKYFYSRPDPDGLSTLDDLITDLERSLDADLQTVRVNMPGELVDPATAARLVSHLMLRTAHIRSMFTQAVSVCTKEVLALMSDGRRMRAVLGVDTSSILQRAIDEAMEKLPLAEVGYPPSLFRRIAHFFMREQFDQLLPDGLQLVLQALGNLSGQVREAHNRALEQGLSENGWYRELATFTWRGEAVSAAILPDAVVLAAERGGRFMPMLMARRADVQAVVLPVSSERLLVGRRPSGDRIDLDDFNAAAAANSDDFFIAASPVQDDSLCALIGTAPLNAITSLVDGVIGNIGGRPRKAPATPDVAPMVDVPGVLSFSVTYTGFADEALAAEITEVVKIVVGQLSRTYPMGELDGITFAADYRAAIEELDRGSDDLPPASTDVLSYGRGVAKTVTVIRDGHLKSHIVLDALVATGLVHPEPPWRECWVHLLVKMLMQIVYRALYERPLMAKTIQWPEDRVGQLLYSAIETCPCAFYSSRGSAFVGPTIGKVNARLVIDSLAHARVVVAAAREQWTLDHDMDRLLDVAVPCVRAVLVHAADWLGHRDGSPEGSLEGDADLPALLANEGLASWLELFGCDLQALYDDPGGLEPARLFSLERHVERLLWALGLFPWETDHGQVFISVP